jgi:predicted CoA-binding protein
MIPSEKGIFFFKSKIIAVVGISLNKPGPANLVYDLFKQSNLPVFGISKSLSEYKNDTMYPSLSALPQIPEAVFIALNKNSTLKLTAECIDLGVNIIWLHDMMGTCVKKRNSVSSVNEEAVLLAEKNSIQVIAGSCPMQFLQTDLFHLCLNKVNLWTGRIK